MDLAKFIREEIGVLLEKAIRCYEYSRYDDGDVFRDAAQKLADEFKEELQLLKESEVKNSGDKG